MIYNTTWLTFSLHFDVNLRHKIFINLFLRLRKLYIQNLETRDLINIDFEGLNSLQGVGRNWMALCTALQTINFEGLCNLQSVSDN